MAWIRIRMDPELLPGSGTRKIQSWIWIRNKSFRIHNTGVLNYLPFPHRPLHSVINCRIPFLARFWWAGLLDQGDLQLVDPGRGAVIAQLHQLSTTKQAILADDTLNEDEKAEKVSSRNHTGSQCCGSKYIDADPEFWPSLDQDPDPSLMFRNTA